MSSVNGLSGTQVVTEKQPTEQQLEDARFAWRCVKHVKSNAITIAKNSRMLGMVSFLGALEECGSMLLVQLLILADLLRRVLVNPIG